jgi:hypothetical protein
MYKPVHLVLRTCVKELLVVIDGLYPHCEAKNSESWLEIKTKLSSTVISKLLKLLSVVITVTFTHELQNVNGKFAKLCHTALHCSLQNYIYAIPQAG